MTNKLTREDIQAIAQELRNLQTKDEPNTQARAQSQNVRKTEGRKSKKIDEGERGASAKNIATVGIILVWAFVFLVLCIKLAPYI